MCMRVRTSKQRLYIVQFMRKYTEAYGEDRQPSKALVRQLYY